MSVLVDQNTQLMFQGFTGTEAQLSRSSVHRLRNQGSGRRHARQGRAAALDAPVFDTVAEAVKRDGRERVGHFCAAALCGGRDYGSGGAGVPLVVCITEGIPTIDMVQVRAFMKEPSHALNRSQLPGRHFAREVQDWHHAGHIHLQGNVGVVSRSAR